LCCCANCQEEEARLQLELEKRSKELDEYRRQELFAQETIQAMTHRLLVLTAFLPGADHVKGTATLISMGQSA